VHISGQPKTLAELDKGELLMLARKYATVLQVEFGQIIVPPKRGDAETVEPVLDTPEPVKPRARKKSKRKSRVTAQRRGRAR
jgi:hypothetical protein